MEKVLARREKGAVARSYVYAVGTIHMKELE